MSETNRIDYSTIDDDDLLFDDLDEDVSYSILINSSKINNKKTQINEKNEDKNAQDEAKDEEDRLLFKIPDMPLSTNKNYKFDNSVICTQEMDGLDKHKLENTLDSLFGDGDSDNNDEEDEEDFLIRTQPFFTSTQISISSSQAVKNDEIFKIPDLPSQIGVQPEINQNKTNSSKPLSNHNRSIISTQTPNELLHKSKSDIDNNNNNKKNEQQQQTSSLLKKDTIEALITKKSNAEIVKIVDQSIDSNIWNVALKDLYKLFNSANFNEKNVFDKLNIKYYYEKVILVKFHSYRFSFFR
jgi:hypothetical protein